MTPLENTNRRVRVAAAARGWTLGELAAQAFIAHATLSRAISGKTPWEPGSRVESPLFRVASALEVPIGSLRVGGEVLILVSVLLVPDGIDPAEPLGSLYDAPRE